MHYFIKIDNAKDIEKQFKTMYESRRVDNINGNKSEWIVMSLGEIFSAISFLIYQSKTIIEGRTHIINFNSSKDKVGSLTEKFQTCHVTAPQITIQTTNTSILPSASNNISEDEITLNNLKQLRQTRELTLTESQLYRKIQNRLDKRKERKRKEERFKQLEQQGVKLTFTPITPEKKEYFELSNEVRKSLLKRHRLMLSDK